MKTDQSTDSVQLLVMASLFAALTCIVTLVIRIPSPLEGYLNLGDSIVLLGAWICSPLPSFLAAAVGSALADLISGYAFYAPATFLIKGIVALIACLGFRLLRRKFGETVSELISGIVAEFWMVSGYLLFESVFYGFLPSTVNILPNALQGAVGLILSLLLIRVLRMVNRNNS